MTCLHLLENGTVIVSKYRRYELNLVVVIRNILLPQDAIIRNCIFTHERDLIMLRRRHLHDFSTS